MTTPNSTISEPYKHLTIAKAYIARQIAPWRKRHIWVWSVSDVSVPGSGSVTMLTAMVNLRLSLQLRLSVLNEMHTNSYSGPRQKHKNIFQTFSNQKHNSSTKRSDCSTFLPKILCHMQQNSWKLLFVSVSSFLKLF